MAITLYELAGADADRRFSPYCWRVRMALLHKGLSFETEPVRFSEKDKIAFSGQGLVPVLVDGERTVTDSFAIATYLEDTYRDAPSLFGDASGLARFATNAVDGLLTFSLVGFIVTDVFAVIAEQDRAYFRESREKRLGMSLEAFAAGRDERLPAFRESLEPLRRTVREQKFLCGAKPGWVDYVAFASFQWARCTSPYQLLATDDPLHGWRERMLDLFGGEGRKAVGFPV
jgi:glutathione S-transferase